ncbi:MAG: CDP-alcohol phosphatidyltransferase family protein [Bryobacteraceae bacterium]|jgi:cardiolipin synthase
MPGWMNAANGLTALRLLLAPPIVAAMWAGRHGLALALFAFAAATDVLDGAAARQFDQATPLGAYLDPIADKCLLNAMFLAMAGARMVPWWFVVIVLGRDIYLLLAAAILLRFTSRRKFPPSVWGKASTFVQIVTAIAALAAGMSGQSNLWIPVALIRISAVFTVWSGVEYTWRGIGVVRAH